MNRGSRVFIRSNGCVPNLLEAEKIRQFLVETGFMIVFDYRLADIIIFSSCGFSPHKREESRSVIEEYSQNKEKETKIILTGCLNKIDPIGTAKMLDKKSIIDISEIGKKFGSNIVLNRLFASGNIISDALETTREDIYNIITSVGCLGNCSYCVIKRARGSIKSKPVNDILKEIMKGMNNGFKKFILWGDDLGAYGQDMSYDYIKLLKSIMNKFRNTEMSLYLHRLNPQWLHRYLGEYLKLADNKMIKLIYSPMQSGSNKILNLMEREYSKEDLIRIFKLIKEALPSITIKTDIMVGFPSEEESDFIETLEVVEETRIDDVSVFRYGDAPGTRSFFMKNKVDGGAVGERIAMLWKKFPSLRYVLRYRNGKYRLVDKGTADEMGNCRAFGPISPDCYA